MKQADTASLSHQHFGATQPRNFDEGGAEIAFHRQQFHAPLPPALDQSGFPPIHFPMNVLHHLPSDQAPFVQPTQNMMSSDTMSLGTPINAAFSQHDSYLLPTFGANLPVSSGTYLPSASFQTPAPTSLATGFTHPSSNDHLVQLFTMPISTPEGPLEPPVSNADSIYPSQLHQNMSTTKVADPTYQTLIRPAKSTTENRPKNRKDKKFGKRELYNSQQHSEEHPPKRLAIGNNVP